MTTDPLTHAQSSLAIARDGALDTVLRLTARLAEQQAELARLRAEIAALERDALLPCFCCTDTGCSFGCSCRPLLFPEEENND